MSASLGFLNPLLYAMGRHGGDFDDVTQGNNAIALSTLAANEYYAGDRASTWRPDSGARHQRPSSPRCATAPRPRRPLRRHRWPRPRGPLSFHTGSSAYPVGATVTIAAPPGTTLPGDSPSWPVHTSLGSHAPTAVQVVDGPSSSTANVATLTLADGTSAVDAVGIAALGVTNPSAVGAAKVTITNSVDHLTSTAPLALGAATPSPGASTVAVTGGSAAVSGAACASPRP